MTLPRLSDSAMTSQCLRGQVSAERWEAARAEVTLTLHWRLHQLVGRTHLSWNR